MTKSLKILLTTFEFPPQPGGMQLYYYNLVKNLANFSVSVLTLSQPNSQVFDQQQSFKISRQQFLSLWVWPRWLRLLKLMKKSCQQEKINLNWVGDLLPVGNCVYILKKQTGQPYFISLHGYDYQLSQRNASKRRLSKKILAQADFLTVNSHYLKEKLVQSGLAPEKIEVIYPCPNDSLINLVDEQIKAELKSKFQLAGKKIILTTGRLVKRKGQAQLIKALPKILEKFPNLLYVIIGRGPEEQSLLDLAQQLSVSDQLLILTDCADQELANWYALADLFAMTPLKNQQDIEGFGIVYLEAASFALPIVAATVGGTAEAVIDQQTGLMVDSAKPTEISEKIIYLLNNPEAAKVLGQRAKDMVLQEFQWSKQTAKLISRLTSYEQ